MERKESATIYDEFDEVPNNVLQELNKPEPEKPEISNEDLQQIVNEDVQKSVNFLGSTIKEDKKLNMKQETMIQDVKKEKFISIPFSSKIFKNRDMLFNEGLTEEEKSIKRSFIVKIRNYIDCFANPRNHIRQSARVQTNA